MTPLVPVSAPHNGQPTNNGQEPQLIPPLEQGWGGAAGNPQLLPQKRRISARAPEKAQSGSFSHEQQLQGTLPALTAP